MKRILIAGGTGFIGKNLILALSKRGYYLSVLTRRKNQKSLNNVQYYHWDLKSGEIDLSAFKDVDTIINLTGANLGAKRWTTKRKKEIIDSRINAIKLLFKATQENNINIKTLISSSAVGYYGAFTSNTIFQENAPNGEDFTGRVCKDWEETAKIFTKTSSRVIIFRKGIVIGKEGAYNKMAPLAKWWINPALGNGKQFLPWIDIEDLIRIYVFFLEHKQLNGVFNAVATEHINMNDFSKKLLTSFKRKSILPNVPAFIVKIIFGEMSKLLLEGSRVSNSKIKEAGFQFKNDNIESTLNRLSLSYA